jgi:hypothetical protein
VCAKDQNQPSSFRRRRRKFFAVFDYNQPQPKHKLSHEFGVKTKTLAVKFGNTPTEASEKKRNITTPAIRKFYVISVEIHVENYPAHQLFKSRPVQMMQNIGNMDLVDISIEIESTFFVFVNFKNPNPPSFQSVTLSSIEQKQSKKQATD